MLQTSLAALDLAQAERFSEIQELFAPVSGIVSVPHEPVPCPAVVLLAGSGSVDRDETLGRNKPFRTSRGAWPAGAWRCCGSTR